MKKIIALAVASAFVAPVMAADVSVSGTLTYNYIASDDASTGDAVQRDDSLVTIKGTSETAGGYTVTGTFNIVDDGGDGDKLDTQGSNITIKGALGALEIGDVSGAMDATGDWTDRSPVFGGFDGDGSDAVLNYASPSFNGLVLEVSTSPSGANSPVAESALSNSTFGANAETEGLQHSAISLTYTMGPFAAYIAEEDSDRAAAQTVKADAMGIKYSANGVYVALETGNAKNAGADSDYTARATAGHELEFRGLAASYKMGDVTFGVEQQQTKVKAATAGTGKVEDETIVFVSMNLGGGLSVYAANRSSDSDYAATVADQADQSAVGISYSF